MQEAVSHSTADRSASSPSRLSYCSNQSLQRQRHTWRRSTVMQGVAGHIHDFMTEVHANLAQCHSFPSSQQQGPTRRRSTVAQEVVSHITADKSTLLPLRLNHQSNRSLQRRRHLQEQQSDFIQMTLCLLGSYFCGFLAYPQSSVATVDFTEEQRYYSPSSAVTKNKKRRKLHPSILTFAQL